MRQNGRLGSALLGGSCLLLSVLATHAEDPARLVQIAGVQATANRAPSVPEPARGIQSYGRGAARSDLPAAIGAEFGTGQEQRSSAAATGTSFKISGASMAGNVAAFALSPDGETAVYIADQDTPGRFELYSAPVDGSAQPTKISAGIPFGPGDQGVSLFEITPNSASVVFLADPSFGNGIDEVFSAPIDGSASPSQLSSASQAPISGLGILPNSAVAAYFGVSSGSVELFKATINAPTSPTQLSDAGAANPSGNVVAAAFSADSTRVVYAADSEVDNVFQWYSVPTAASGPGQGVQLSSALSFVSLAAIAPDNSAVVYTADEIIPGVSELFSVPISGGSSTRLNPSMAGAGVTSIRFGPGSQRVAYRADQDMPGVTEAYSALVGATGSGSRLNGPMNASQSVRSVAISPDGAIAVYEADENTPETVDLMAVPIDGGGPPYTLHGLFPPDNAGLFAGIGTPIIGPRALYPVIGTAVNLFSVPIGGADPFTQVNDPLVAGESIFNAFVPSTATRLMAYATGAIDDGIATRAFSAPIRSDLAPEQINATAASDAIGVMAYEISSQEDYAVFLQDQDTNGKVELYSYALDSDGDSVPNAADNCKFLSNPSQNDLLFDQTVLASSGTTFDWSVPTDVRFVRGPLSAVAGLTTDDAGSLVEASSYTDATQPAAAGGGSYYLFAQDCPGGSYQTGVGAEPLRDTLLP